VTFVVAVEQDCGVGSEPSRSDDIAGPMFVLIHAREPNQRRRSVTDRRNVPGGARPRTTHLTTRRGRCGKRDRYVSRGERRVVIARESPSEKEVVSRIYVSLRSGPTDRPLSSFGQHAA